MDKRPVFIKLPFTICLKIAFKTNCKFQDILALVCLLCKIRSGLKVSPLIKLGDGNEGRSA